MIIVRRVASPTVVDSGRTRPSAFTRTPVPCSPRARIEQLYEPRLDPLGGLRNALYAPRKRYRRKRAAVICILLPRLGVREDDHCNATRAIRSSVCIRTPWTRNSSKNAGRKIATQHTMRLEESINLESLFIILHVIRVSKVNPKERKKCKNIASWDKEQGRYLSQVLGDYRLKAFCDC